MHSYLWWLGIDVVDPPEVMMGSSLPIKKGEHSVAHMIQASLRHHAHHRCYLPVVVQLSHRHHQRDVQHYFSDGYYPRSL